MANRTRAGGLTTSAAAAAAAAAARTPARAAAAAVLANRLPSPQGRALCRLRAGVRRVSCRSRAPPRNNRARRAHLACSCPYGAARQARERGVVQTGSGRAPLNTHTCELK
eukprot:scaffold570_cov382-Prasinococcus_capsulatus_cf.AAC.5